MLMLGFKEILLVPKLEVGTTPWSNQPLKHTTK